MIDFRDEDENHAKSEHIKVQPHYVLQKVKSNRLMPKTAEMNSYSRPLLGQILNLPTILYEYIRKPFDEKFIQISS